MVRALALAALVIVACSGPRAPAPTVSPSGDVVVTSAVPNGRVEFRIKASYVWGQQIKATVRLVPTTGTLRGPIEPYIQASGFSGTAVVRHLAPLPVTASASAAAESELTWDATDDAGRQVPEDDYSLVIAVIDDQGRRTTVGATISVRAR